MTYLHQILEEITFYCINLILEHQRNNRTDDLTWTTDLVSPITKIYLPLLTSNYFILINSGVWLKWQDVVTQFLSSYISVNHFWFKKEIYYKYLSSCYLWTLSGWAAAHSSQQFGPKNASRLLSAVQCTRISSQ